MTTVIVLFLLGSVFHSFMWIFQWYSYWKFSPFRLISESRKNPFWYRFWHHRDLSYHNQWKDANSLKGEAFLYSSRYLAWTTQAWKLAQMLYLSCFQLAILIALDLAWYWIIIGFIAMKAILGGIFELTLKHLKANWLYRLTKRLLKS